MTERLLTDIECAQLAGVSLETVREYQRVGLLSGTDDQRFLESEVRRVFQLAATTGTATATAKTAPDVPPSAPEQPVRAPEAPPQPGRDASSAPAGTPGSEQLHVTYTHPGPTNSYELLEVSRTLKDQIEMLKQERDWLRRRVEVLESRSERDQMMLLSENKTVQSLLTVAAKPRSGFWSFALPWLRSSDPERR